MASSLLKILFVVVTLCFVNGGDSDFGESACLKVPASKFEGTVRSTYAVVRQIITTLSNFSGGAALGDFRLSTAVSDCLDLMDFSLDLLNSTLSASQNANGKDNNTENVSTDTKFKLCGVLVNPDTCREGFNGTNNHAVKNLISGDLDRVTSLAHDLLSMVNSNSTTPSKGGVGGGGGARSSGGVGGGRKLITNENFPDWLKSHDRKLLQAASGATADVVVAGDGTGNFTTIGEAIGAAPEKSNKRFVIYIKKGVYKEYVEINKKKWNIMLIGEGMDATIISGNHNFADGWTTYRSATFGVRGKGFIARDITFENTAGPEKLQAVAYRSDSDQSVLYRCAIRGYQDTLYAHCMRHFYKDCKISGTVDFLFGRAAAVFQTCEIRARKGLPNQKNTITAQGRNDTNELSGFSIQFCNVSADPDVLASLNSTLTYLGRPWRLYSTTVVMESYISNAIRPEGWLEWIGTFALDTLFYGEYMNYGPGAALSGRVKWPGYHMLNNDSGKAYEFTVARLIYGNAWLPSTGVRYTAGLTN